MILCKSLFRHRASRALQKHVIAFADICAVFWERYIYALSLNRSVIRCLMVADYRSDKEGHCAETETVC